MRNIVIDRHSGKVQSIVELPFDDYELVVDTVNQEVIQGFQPNRFDLITYEYYFNGVSFDELIKSPL